MPHSISASVSRLGDSVVDPITGATGVIKLVAFNLDGTVTALIDRPVGSDGEMRASEWLDISRCRSIAGGPDVRVGDFAP